MVMQQKCLAKDFNLTLFCCCFYLLYWMEKIRSGTELLYLDYFVCDLDPLAEKQGRRGEPPPPPMYPWYVLSQSMLFLFTDIACVIL